ncbi:hypothetical protein AA106555_1334 [Neokomagataea thailandica NBRC 106555]|uniref:DUF1643 domain-containing protein n=2 Tax=Neokomagataea TaxID=1223423 RepID=A0A4Y6V5Q3_9PROT|nr:MULTISPECIES: DUF1643 domain-containing protein [Neokomagataea]QDH25399.1 DUF1643 domain-containing protein [Neokomagataea tanensis]GBR53533.1 hypothetical protein AA106555_1334 [Neokomagataea thailandica NBRC 106555]
MKDLFGAYHNVGTAKPLKLADDIKSTAVYGGKNDCYRYSLKRVWQENAPKLMWLMMNPSVATEFGDDRTVAKCQRYARQWGYGSILVANSFAYRCTDQKRLIEVEDPIGPENDSSIVELAREADLVILAYGSPQIRQLKARGTEVALLLEQNGITLNVLRLSKSGRPEHPLYLPADLRPFPIEASTLQK